VSERAQRAFEAWKEADALARDAETQLASAWDKYFARRGGEPPARELVREVARLRVLANSKLGNAMEALGGHPGDTTIPVTRTRSSGHAA
jgi:ferric-dicitrate binding protein FerR (iron transport regulator)